VRARAPGRAPPALRRRGPARHPAGAGDRRRGRARDPDRRHRPWPGDRLLSWPGPRAVLSRERGDASVRERAAAVDVPGAPSPVPAAAALPAQARRAAAPARPLAPAGAGGRVRLPVDGFFEPLERLDRERYERSLARLKLLAGLVAYRQDVPQEGRLDGGGE